MSKLINTLLITGLLITSNPNMASGYTKEELHTIFNKFEIVIKHHLNFIKEYLKSLGIKNDNPRKFIQYLIEKGHIDKTFSDFKKLKTFLIQNKELIRKEAEEINKYMI